MQRRLASGREWDLQYLARASSTQVCGEMQEGLAFDDEEDSEEELSDVARPHASQTLAFSEGEALASGEHLLQSKAHGDPADWPSPWEKAARFPRGMSSFGVRARPIPLHAHHQAPNFNSAGSLEESRLPGNASHHLGSLAAQQHTPTEPRAEFSGFYALVAPSSSGEVKLSIHSHTGPTLEKAEEISLLHFAVSPDSSGIWTSVGSQKYPAGAAKTPHQETPTSISTDKTTLFTGDASITSGPISPQLPESTLDLYVNEALQHGEIILESWLLDPDSSPPASPSSEVSQHEEEHEESKEDEEFMANLLQLLQEAEDLESRHPPSTEPPPVAEATRLIGTGGFYKTTSQPPAALVQTFLVSLENVPSFSHLAVAAYPEPYHMPYKPLGPEQPSYTTGSPATAFLPQQSKEGFNVAGQLVSAAARDEPSVAKPVQVSQSGSGTLTDALRQEPPSIVDSTYYEMHPFFRLPAAPTSLNLPPLKHDASGRVGGSLPRMLSSLQALLAKPSLNEEEVTWLHIIAEELVHHARCRMTTAIGGLMASTFDLPLMKRFLVADALWSACQVLGPSMGKGLWWNDLMNDMLADPLNWSPVNRRRTARRGHVNRVLAAFRHYRAGERPSAREVVEIKHTIFCRKRSAYYFRRPVWNLWRDLHKSYGGACVDACLKK
ncbi:hypothetical protein Esti_003504 [Eimeria stiedai]